MIKICFKLENYPQALEYYTTLLTYVQSAVSRAYSEKSINTILDRVSNVSQESVMEQFYTTTLENFNDTSNENIWVKTNLKYAKLLLDKGDYGKLKGVLTQCHQACQTEDGVNDQRKGTLLLEVLSLEIQMYTQTQDIAKLKNLYQQCLNIKSAVPHPRIMGIIRECGGKMHMREMQWKLAQIDFFESFKSYDEAGLPQRFQVLKYLILSHMLSDNYINPFDSVETKSYQNHPSIVPMTNLVQTYQNKELEEFQKTLKKNHVGIMDDPFIRSYMDDVLRNIRLQALTHLLVPYTSIKIDYISKRMNIDTELAINLATELIMDGKINLKIDQVNGRLIMDKTSTSVDIQRCQAVLKWANSLKPFTGRSLDSALRSK
ncbi:putative COP9 signalosome complex subunit 2 [Conidiobolus coronatus NRRL 28638]|uniref:COP9 signalosome complex subunit 2 n=1 Tax=Conidiobolus coronatus (strain ATCC 28846 / CBS 209.66 / NRRL 28638) TaxID=796925 RepID=A0A137P875_CONC2|nr:putative COP9 signalosome complex subunit 2 [Conidiobolus coronatus NRRL 28638]|eukprot:KXN71182.1 putative COP9 signalosome complex subunit 2 [Conidiobolus coronatus NRRL 28638]